MGTGSLIHPLFVLVYPPLSLQLADKPNETKLRLGIGSLADHGGVIEVIDTDGIDVYEHDGVPLVATGLTRGSTAAVAPVFPDGTEPGKEDLAQILMTYLSELEPPEPLSELEPPEPEPPDVVKLARSLWCRLFPRLCR